MKQISPLILLGLLSSGCSSLEELKVSSPFWRDEASKSSAPKTTVASAPAVMQPEVVVEEEVVVEPGIITSEKPVVLNPEPAKGWRFNLSMFESKKVDRSGDAPVVDPVGETLVDMEPPAGKLKTIPAPAEPVVTEQNLNPRNPADAEVFAMENRWFHENVWLYPDQKYAIKSPQNIKGKWNKTGGLLRMQPYHGGLLLFSKGKHGNWISEAGGASTLRPVQSHP